jgi:hypothetical protein
MLLAPLAWATLSLLSTVRAPPSPARSTLDTLLPSTCFVPPFDTEWRRVARAPQATGAHRNGECWDGDGERDMQMHGCAAVWEQAAAAEQQQQEIAWSAAMVRVLGRALREELAAEEAGGEEPVPPWYTRWWAAVALATAAIATFITWAIDTVGRLLVVWEHWQWLRAHDDQVLPAEPDRHALEQQPRLHAQAPDAAIGSAVQLQASAAADAAVARLPVSAAAGGALRRSRRLGSAAAAGVGGSSGAGAAY